MNEIVKARLNDVPQAQVGTPDRVLRGKLLSAMQGIRHGRLSLHDALGRVDLGCGADSPAPLQVQLRVNDMRFYRALALNGSVGAGEAYADGWWRCDDLVTLVRLLVLNRDLLDQMEGGIARVGGMVMRAWHALRDNTRTGARRNIAAHYDLGNAFFSLFLSPDLMYSSALWRDPGDTLETASTRKLDAICRKLDLKPGDRVVEIGSGWGGFALHAAKHYGCHVTTATISREQHALASRRIAEAGLREQVTLLLKDYRDLDGQYDKLVSIEMIEAVGARYLPVYFAKLGALLKPEGIGLVQAITIEDHRYAQALASVDFIKRHIFPGSFIPSLNAMLAAKTRASELALVHQEDFGLSYALTLRAWRERFLARLSEARAQGYDERFLRLWEFYLAYCEGGFLERSIGVSHLLLAKPGARPGPGGWAAQSKGLPA
ncbi:MAG TPA: cyclopropane-fatty-acyl-phospholipid synthase family protein [Dyella sp.]|uniref:cyclopropane-fatty-acyl-phospholipid synthase family protein n=1 Tax=Dyella sp. TaxID=1869338 RepID=UPI002D76C650|nr:cyclopropane-fatty-acyl-phospholipid synthase family protein [Dyella sp.]HET6554304.1 cyclopropane-fatty-acyl-phospholipid synthase family protein [Dyella sp.]